MTYREGLRFVARRGVHRRLARAQGVLHMAIYRSPYPHARIKKVDVSDVWKRGARPTPREDLLRIIQ
ncbi:hypothetical protein, partial [Pyrobaculum aerophilum]|uniref:hypothetical protein n=1 Tax=Pyrobaculum aerophilum TaxID=13773 RepID=UPI0021624BBD